MKWAFNAGSVGLVVGAMLAFAVACFRPRDPIGTRLGPFDVALSPDAGTHAFVVRAAVDSRETNYGGAGDIWAKHRLKSAPNGSPASRFLLSLEMFPIDGGFLDTDRGGRSDAGMAVLAEGEGSVADADGATPAVTVLRHCGGTTHCERLFRVTWSLEGPPLTGEVVLEGEVDLLYHLGDQGQRDQMTLSLTPVDAGAM